MMPRFPWLEEFLRRDSSNLITVGYSRPTGEIKLLVTVDGNQYIYRAPTIAQAIDRMMEDIA